MSDDPRSLNQLLQRVRKSGLKVNNWFHRMDGMWQANLRKADNSLFFAWAYGVDAEDAMTKALDNALGGKTAYRALFREGDDDLDPTLVGTTKGDALGAIEDAASAEARDELADLLG